MPLTLTITDPHLLTEQERLAVLTFCGVRVEQRTAEKIAGARSEPRDSVREVIAATVAQIDPADNPTAGVVPVPPVPTGVSVPPPAATTEIEHKGEAYIPKVLDAATIFGGAPTAAPSVPIPPSPSPVPAVPSAVSATGAASAPSAGGSDAPAAPPNPTNALDGAGMPWDHRIHATTKTKNADGTWRQKRGVDPALIVQVTEQNKRLMAIPAVVVPVPTAPVTPVATGMTFLDLMDQVVKLINGGKLSLEAANAACLPMGVTQLHQLDKRPDLIDSAWTYLKTAARVV